ncbi:uncharacterized protein BJ171DRAFT_214947 [Polychytrium aggregatum]|uniref:uncharacterized protein n=1 Tax=Polychytrium aggregatum TaxID=110093 RepID=UPI0022FEBAC2|nr:uncharacterized protein BJ171DRAFT_214947 [Polychytrium aggregatum]KAI9199512.1 hypothetical protein BJ171DRAFT_214947 [Polychytrium aggregatum]
MSVSLSTARSWTWSASSQASSTSTSRSSPAPSPATSRPRPCPSTILVRISCMNRLRLSRLCFVCDSLAADGGIPWSRASSARLDRSFPLPSPACLVCCHHVLTHTRPAEALEKGCHAGPQIREFEKVIWEYDGDIGICPLIESEYQRITDSIHESRSKIGAFHQKYSTFSYPFSALPQLSAVDEEIAKVWKVLHSALVKQDTAVFCSEMAALLYSELSVVGFEADTAHTSTPLAQQVAPCFGGVCYFVKSSGRSFLWPDGKTIPLRQAKPRSASSNTSK